MPGHRRGKAQYALASNPADYRKLFERYRGRIQYWEMLNEPDIPWGPVENAPKSEAYIELAQKTAAILREVDPQAQLMSAGWCTLAASARGMGPFHREAMVALKDVFDVHCFHGQGPFLRYAKHTIQGGLLPMRQELGITIPWYANETALTSRGAVTEKIQAEALHKKLLFSWSRGSIGYTWYNMRSKGELPDDGEHNYGMMTWDFYPKAVYAAYNGLTGLYHDKDFDRACDLPCNEWAFVFKGDCELAVALWNDGEADIPRVFRTDAAAAEVVDLFGNRQALTLVDGTVLVTTTNEPQTLLLSGARIAELLPVPCQSANRLDGAALFTLADHTKVTQLFVGDPAKEDSTWKGAADLSAKAGPRWRQASAPARSTPRSCRCSWPDSARAQARLSADDADLSADSAD